MKLSELAAQTGARCESSDGEIEITGAAGLDQAQPGEVTFLSNPRYTPKVAATGASAIFVSEDVEVPRADLTVLRTKDPYLAFTRALILFHPEAAFQPSISSWAAIDDTARIGNGVSVGAHTVIGKNVNIGERVRIHAN